MTRRRIDDKRESKDVMRIRIEKEAGSISPNRIEIRRTRMKNKTGKGKTLLNFIAKEK